MLNALSRFALAITIVVAAIAAFLVARERAHSTAFKVERDTLRVVTRQLLDSIEVAKFQLARHTRDSKQLTDSMVILEDRIDRTLVSNAALRAEAQQLRARQLNVPLTSSVPGSEPTAGDTLRQCRTQLALCDERAQKETQRADSLGVDLFEARFQLSAARSDIGMWQQSSRGNLTLLDLTRGQLESAQQLLKRAEPPCRGVPFLGCPSRGDAALWASAVTLALVSQKPEARAVAVALVVVSFVW